MGGLCCSANEICRESKRQTINADDVLKAVEELDFPEFCEPLKAALAGVCFHSLLFFAYL
jgi:DNA polymerase epsilon subunit 3